MKTSHEARAKARIKSFMAAGIWFSPDIRPLCESMLAAEYAVIAQEERKEVGEKILATFDASAGAA